MNTSKVELLRTLWEIASSTERSNAIIIKDLWMLQKQHQKHLLLISDHNVLYVTSKHFWFPIIALMLWLENDGLIYLPDNATSLHSQDKGQNPSETLTKDKIINEAEITNCDDILVFTFFLIWNIKRCLVVNLVVLVLLMMI